MPVSLISAEEEDGLPEDDDAAAFVQKERICRDEMNRILARYGQNDDDSEVWREYVVQVIAAGNAYGFGTYLPERPDRSDREEFWRFYEGSVTLASTLARQSRREKSASTVSLNQAEKARLGTHLADLKRALEASSLSEKLKANLRKRLDGFEEELGKDRSNLARILVATSIVVGAIGGAGVTVIGGVEKLEDVIIKLPSTLDAVAKITGKAKSDELERLPEEKALPSPPKALPAPKLHLAHGYGRRSVGLDDEIPF